MTQKQLQRLREQLPPRFHPKFAELVDKGEISLTNASIAVKLIPEDQLLLAFQAMNFNQRSFAATVNWWLRLTKERRTMIRQIIEDLADAFDGWELWTGGEEQEEFNEVRGRVFAFLAGLKVVLPERMNDAACESTRTLPDPDGDPNPGGR
jgi:hypothetical protein